MTLTRRHCDGAWSPRAAQMSGASRDLADLGLAITVVAAVSCNSPPFAPDLVSNDGAWTSRVAQMSVASWGLADLGLAITVAAAVSCNSPSFALDRFFPSMLIFSLSFSRPHFFSLGLNLNVGSDTMLKGEKKFWKKKIISLIVNFALWQGYII